MASQMTISWEATMPVTGLKPNSIYIIDPGAGNKPQVFVTNKTGSSSYQVNPNQDLTAFIKTVNGLAPNGAGNLDLTMSFTNGVLSFSGQGATIDLDARYVKLTDYTPWKNATDGRLDSLENAVTNGLKTPVAFSAATNPTWPTQTKGFTYKVTVAGTTSGVALEIGDTIIYDTTGNTPFVVQSNVDSATTTIKGLIKIATQTDVNSGTGSDAAVVPATLAARLTLWLTSTTASQIEVNAGSIDNKFITPLKNKVWFDSVKASQGEVDAGTVDTKYVTPLTLQTKIATALSSVHTHSNKAFLDKVGETGTGEMTYNGDAVYTVGNKAW